MSWTGPYVKVVNTTDSPVPASIMFATPGGGPDTPVSADKPFPVTANAGTNLDTSLLALESGGNLAAIKLDVDKLPSDPARESGNLLSIKTDLDEIALDTDNLAGIKTDTDKIPSDPSREGGNLATLAAVNFSTATLQSAGNSSLSDIDAQVAKLPVSQSATILGQYGTLSMAGVNNADPLYVDSQVSPLSVTTGGRLRVEGRPDQVNPWKGIMINTFNFNPFKGVHHAW